ncbi:hypothetical protein DFH07DRAFT_730860 [Mycena maculata]|uniref:Uncharacterized protein n=1 Tax=Mycena maculata TaxID=230809 RepID=A0AAD7NWD3_9AGAR|nr:hypothetical protein DFH07DRAFT_730860 [Mycena maculata]
MDINEDAIAQLPNAELFAFVDVDSDDTPGDAACPTVELPPRFIFVKHHPHANKPNEIIPLDGPSETAPEGVHASTASSTPTDRPWAPFRTYGDFKFMSRRVKRRSPNAEIDEDLRDLRDGSLSSNSLVTFRNHRDMEKVLAAARTLTIEFEGTHLGGTYNVDVEFRDPWSVMTQWVCDPTLSPISTWFSQEKYLCLNGMVDFSDPLYDEPRTGKTWGRVDDDLPGDGHYPSCFLPLHVWLDKGLVSTKVKMHPILIRACWIHSTTRNGSGNGGSALVGFVKMARCVAIDPHTLSASSRTEYDRLKREIYRGVCETIMASLRDRSHHGEALRFGDGVVRVAHPGVLIESMDFEELAAWLSIRNSRSLHPCPQCLVHKDDLHRLSCSYPARTAAAMSTALAQAPDSSKTQRNEHLKAYGLHDFEASSSTCSPYLNNPCIQHFLWSFAYSDPYEATGYDCLHFFDGGTWGRHVWVLLKGYLQSNGLATSFNTNMDKFPRWRDLKHLSSPTTIDYSDGQTFLDILKCALPCLVQILPTNSCLVKLVRIMQKVRIMLGLEVTTASRLKLLRKWITEYEKVCKACRPFHDKSFDFLKQHFLSHAMKNFEGKGTSCNMNTRVGEGFQQEVAAQYKKTNGKNAEHQISIMDENEETMARIQMVVDEWLKNQEEDEKEQILGPSNTESPGHWKLGSPDPRITTIRIETVNQGNLLFRDFNLKLREYLARYHPSHVVRPDQDIQIEPCKVLYVDYQSKVDWKLGQDILRCNPCFHTHPRYGSIIYEAQDDDLAMGQLELVFRCHLPQKVTLDLAMIQPYHKSSWAPRTRTDCPIREWSPRSAFIALEHITRGALLCPIFGASREVFYVVDCIDEDMFLRVNEID